jgi:hypothetical protein
VFAMLPGYYSQCMKGISSGTLEGQSANSRVTAATLVRVANHRPTGVSRVK